MIIRLNITNLNENTSNLSLLLDSFKASYSPSEPFGYLALEKVINSFIYDINRKSSYPINLNSIKVDFDYSSLLDVKETQDKFLIKLGRDASASDIFKYLVALYTLFTFINSNNKVTHERINDIPLQYFEPIGYNDYGISESKKIYEPVIL